jgi:HNH endonuclease
MQLVLGTPLPAEIDLGQPWHLSGPVFGEPRLAPRRLGQQSFKAVVLSAYHGECAITGTKIRPVLEAAHIRPVSPTHGGENRLDNGLLLRSDVHTMFDRGYLAVDPAHRLLVSPRLRADFGNGEQFYSRAGSVIALPDRKPDRPGREFLEWHLGTVFKASLGARRADDGERESPAVQQEGSAPCSQGHLDGDRGAIGHGGHDLILQLREVGRFGQGVAEVVGHGAGQRRHVQQRAVLDGVDGPSARRGHVTTGDPPARRGDVTTGDPPDWRRQHSDAGDR